MRAVNYMKIDFMMTKQQQRVLPLIAVVAVFVGRTMEEAGVMAACSYLIFIATIFSTAPFGSCHRENTGFLLMLPATTAERVLGRFLFGLAYVGISVVACLAGMGVFHLFGCEITIMSAGLLLCNVAVGLFIVALEYLISYIFGEGKNNWLYLGNIVRIAPGMAMYFLFIYIMGRVEEEDYVADRMMFLAQRMVSAGAIAVAVSLLVMAAAAGICVKVIEKRDYA